MLRYRLGTRTICGPLSSRFIVRRTQHTITDPRDKLPSLIGALINRQDLSAVPRSKEKALESSTRTYLAHDKALLNLIKIKNKTDFLDIFENDDGPLLTTLIQELQESTVLSEDHKIKQERCKVPRSNAPMKNYAVFLKYLYEETPDIALIERFYDYLPSPQPLYIKPVHFEYLMGLLLDVDDNHFFLKVISNLRDASLDMTAKEKSKIINNVFKIGHSSPLQIYDYLKSKIELNDVVLFNAVLVNTQRHDQTDLFLQVLEEFLNSGVKLNAESYSLIIKKLGTLKDTERLVWFLENFLDSNQYLTTPLVNSLILSCFSMSDFESGFTLLKWLLEMTQLKPTVDTFEQDKAFRAVNGSLLEFYKQKLDDDSVLPYLLNFNEETAHICLNESLNRGSREGNIEGVFEILDTVDKLGLVLWERSYKNLFTVLYQFSFVEGRDIFSFHELQKLSNHFFSKKLEDLAMILSNEKFRDLYLDLIISKAPDENYAMEATELKRYFKELFEQFYKRYPQGFQSSESKKTGSSRFHKVIMSSIINELKDLLN